MLKDLTYKVVVIDDEEELYEDYTEIIRERLTSEGYLLDPKHIEDLEDLNACSLNEVDLFLVDLKFGKQDKGPEFIKKIREGYLTDILFYSSDALAIHEYRKSGEFQGVFFAVRDENTSEIAELIDQLITKMIKRSNTPLSSRGIVLGSVAELDNIIKSKIATLLSKIDAGHQKTLMDDCTKEYFKSYKSQSKKIGEFWGCEFHHGMKEWSEVKSSYSDYQILELIHNVKITDSHKNLRVLLNTYNVLNGKDETYYTLSQITDLLNDRNIFAHVQEELGEDGIYRFKRLSGEDDLVLSEETCQKLRIAIIKYLSLVNDIEIA